MSAKTAEYVSSERRELSKRFDEVIHQVRHSIAVLALAETFPLAKLERFHSQVGSLFLPNVNHGVVSIPPKYRCTETTPLLVVQKGERYIRDNSFVDHTPTQATEAVATYPYHTGWSGLDHNDHRAILAQARKVLRASPTSLDPLPSDNYAQTDTMAWRLFAVDNSSVYLHCRPLIRYNKPTAKDLAGPVIYHELKHVDQSVRRPFYEDDPHGDRHLRDELEAYDNQNEFSDALLRTDDSTYTNRWARSRLERNQIISQICDLNPMNDRYQPSRRVRSAMRKHKINV